jgi:hypothetical protein
MTELLKLADEIAETIPKQLFGGKVVTLSLSEKRAQMLVDALRAPQPPADAPRAIDGQIDVADLACRVLERRAVVSDEERKLIHDTLLGRNAAIPAGIYFQFENDNFYSVEGGKGCGSEFYRQWRPRWREFPASEEEAREAQRSAATSDTPPASYLAERKKAVYDKLAEEGGGTWATYMMMDIDEAFAAPTPSPDASAVRGSLAALIFKSVEPILAEKTEPSVGDYFPAVSAILASLATPAPVEADIIERCAMLAQNYEDFGMIDHDSIGDVQERDLRLADAIRALKADADTRNDRGDLDNG